MNFIGREKERANNMKNYPNKADRPSGSGQPFSIISLAVAVVSIIGLYLYKPVNLEEVSTIEGFVRYAKSFGVIMPIVIFEIILVQAIVPVIPFVMLCSAAGILIGVGQGIAIIWAGTLTGASITFFLSRTMGFRWALSKHEGKVPGYLEKMNGTGGFLAVLTLRLLPYFPAPIINITAGISQMRFASFFLASAIGKLPFIIGYTYVGNNLINSKNYALMMALFAALIIVPYLIMVTLKKNSS
ncbi:putative membrane protein YdjX (TVP38/TMEM64 family) [Peptococcaceae bacterium DYL19]|nr:putative membrane protein YdjX (TVP38/TMEM64 family) [Phosphitispora fastidiosa]